MVPQQSEPTPAKNPCLHALNGNEVCGKESTPATANTKRPRCEEHTESLDPTLRTGIPSLRMPGMVWPPN